MQPLEKNMAIPSPQLQQNYMHCDIPLRMATNGIKIVTLHKWWQHTPLSQLISTIVALTPVYSNENHMLPKKSVAQGPKPCSVPSDVL